MNDEFHLDQEELEDGHKGHDKGEQPSNWRHWKRALKWLLITVGIVVVGIVIFLYVNVSKISVNPFGFGHLKGEDRGRINIMMLGVGDPGHDGENLSDTNILLSIDTKTHKIAIISVPRDTEVSIPGYGIGKINSANAHGGLTAATSVFEKTLGVPVDYYVKANFTGLKDVVNAVGGIDVTNTTLLSDPEYPCDANQYKVCGYKLTPGQYHLDGAAALKYARCRKGTCGDDYGRAARQQEVMSAIRLKATSGGTLANPITLGKLVSAAGSNIDTNLSISNILRLNQLTKQTPKGDIYNVVLSVADNGFLVQSPYSSDLLPDGGDFSAIQDFVANIFARAPIWTEHAAVIIENGTTTAGLAGTVSKKITTAQPDVQITQVINALTRDHATTQIIDYTAGKKPHTVDYFKNMLKVTTLTPVPAGTTTPPADIVIIVGADYAVPATTTTTPATPSTTTTTR